MKKGLLLGVAGWERPEWCETFYPRDMPAEWRLTYFNTQFACVYLEASFWREANTPLLNAWVEDTHPHFLFLLEDALPEAVPITLAGRALGVRQDEVLWFERQTSLKLLADRLALPVSAERRFLISRDGDQGQIERVRTLLELMGV